MMERRWWLWGLQAEISRLGINVFHGTDFSVPYLPVRPSVMTVHDLSPWMDPGWHIEADRVRNRTPMLLRLGLATIVITPSQAVRRQTMERFHLSDDRVVAVPHAAASIFRPAPAPHAGSPYFLYVGTLEPRKNVQMLIDVWREVRKQYPVDLILAGRRRADLPEIASEPGLQLLGLTPEEELPKLYSGAIACVYPSHYEGFGLPVLEAMQCGAAVIASRDPAISETAGGAALQLNAADGRAWTEALISAVTNPDSMSDLRHKGLQRAAEFSWRRTAPLTREVYSESSRRFAR